jgi:two-component system response regulator (stage 0 sporulation protein A)
MDVQRLLIADPSEIFIDDLTQRLAGTFTLTCCTDGYAAQSLLRSFQPHVVVLDLMMQGLDGIALMDWLNQSQTPPKILITTRFMTPFIERILSRIPFDYVMYKPCDMGVLADRICEVATEPCRDIIMPSAAGSSSTELLRSLQVSSNHKGFVYLHYGLEVFPSMPDASMTKTLYPAIAKHFQVRPDAVERDIRRAICAAWANYDPHTWRMYFDSDRNGYIPRPTNSVFIATLAQRLNMQHRRRA